MQNWTYEQDTNKGRIHFKCVEGQLHVMYIRLRCVPLHFWGAVHEKSLQKNPMVKHTLKFIARTPSIKIQQDGTSICSYRFWLKCINFHFRCYQLWSHFVYLHVLEFLDCMYSLLHSSWPVYRLTSGGRRIKGMPVFVALSTLKNTSQTTVVRLNLYHGCWRKYMHRFFLSCLWRLAHYLINLGNVRYRVQMKICVEKFLRR